jgi:hypothetical protein
LLFEGDAMSETPPDPGFVHDIVESLRVWGSYPLLPVASLLVWALPSLVVSSRAWAWVGLLAVLVGVGWPGTERMWYLWAFQGRTISLRDVVRFTRAYFWRFAKLGLLVGIPLVTLAYALDDNRTLLYSILIPAGFLLDFFLTFVTPALAYSTATVSEALSVGVRMIFAEWPASSWYVLIPPMAILLVSRLAPRSALDTAPRIALSSAATLVALLFKGAIARFYVRRKDVSDEGVISRRERISAWDPEIWKDED